MSKKVQQGEKPTDVGRFVERPGNGGNAAHIWFPTRECWEGNFLSSRVLWAAARRELHLEMQTLCEVLFHRERKASLVSGTFDFERSTCKACRKVAFRYTGVSNHCAMVRILLSRGPVLQNSTNVLNAGAAAE